MDGLLFLWLSWILVIIFVFFSTITIRQRIIIHLLIIIFLSQFFIPYERFEVNLATLYISLATCCFMNVLTFKEQIQIIFASFIIALCRGSYYLFFSLEPLWFTWFPSWGGSLVLAYLSIILIKPNHQRMMSLIMGMVISDVLIYIVHQQTSLMYSMLSLEWLDHLAIIVVMLLIWKKIEELVKSLSEQSKYSQKKEV